jgi:hypothetical protein
MWALLIRVLRTDIKISLCDEDSDCKPDVAVGQQNVAAVRAVAMIGRTNRQRDVAKALTALLPLAPYADMEKIREIALAKKLKTLPPSVAVWLATITHVRHEHTDYDALLAEGYDRDAARFFVVEEINAVLTRWRATRLLEPEESE